MLKNIIKLNSYRNKQQRKAIAEYWMYGYTGKMGNLYDFDFYKKKKLIKKYGNDWRIKLIILSVTFIICLFILFL